MKKKKRAEKSLVPASDQVAEPVYSWQDCKNCGYHFEGNYCPSCGQSIKDYKRPLRFFLGDFFDSMFALDFRVINTIPTLLFQPGKLSAEFAAGKRKKHVAPFRLYFFVSIVFFFLIGSRTTKMVEEVRPVSTKEAADSLSSSANIRLWSTSEEGDTLASEFSRGAQTSLIGAVKSWVEESIESDSLNEEQISEKERFLGYLNNPDVLVGKAYQYVSYTFFILMPWLALILLLFFRRSRKYYVEHLVYSVNLHTFVFIVLILVILLGMIFPALPGKILGYLFLVFIAYALIGIQRFYSQKWSAAIWKTIMLLFIYSLSILIFLIGTAVVFIQLL